MDGGGDGGSQVQDSGTADGGGRHLNDAGTVVLADGGTAPAKVIRPLYFGTSDFPVPANAVAQMDALFVAVGNRFTQETQLRLKLAPAVTHQSSRSCSELGTNAVGILTSIANELAPDGNSKFQVIAPCGDPTGHAAGIAYITGHVALTFDASRQLGNTSAQAFLSTVAMHELGHNLGLIHNSVGNNCMGAVELRSVALGLLGNTETAACVFLPYQRSNISTAVPLFVEDVAPTAYPATSPSLLASPSKLSGQWEVTLTWLGSTTAGSAGWHIERDGTRILKAKTGANSETDSDGPAEYHNDPAMTDPGLVDGQRYCYRLRQFDAEGNEGPLGPERCVNL